MHKPFLVLFLGLSSLAATAQTTDPAPAPAPSPAATPAAAPAVAARPELRKGQRDTIDAIGRLYGKRRLGGKIWMGVVGAGGLTVLRSLSASSSSSTGPGGAPVRTETNGSGIAVVAGIFMGIPLVVAINKLSTYSSDKEDAIVNAYSGGKPLPRSVARKLSSGYFR